jgi:hypothetical protein
MRRLGWVALTVVAVGDVLLWIAAVTRPVAERVPWMGAAAVLAAAVLGAAITLHTKTADQESESDNALDAAIVEFITTADAVHRAMADVVTSVGGADEQTKAEAAGAEHDRAATHLERLTGRQGAIWERALEMDHRLGTDSDGYVRARNSLAMLRLIKQGVRQPGTDQHAV